MSLLISGHELKTHVGVWSVLKRKKSIMSVGSSCFVQCDSAPYVLRTMLGKQEGLLDVGFTFSGMDLTTG